MTCKSYKLVVAALDVGVIDSRYAFVFRHEDLSKINVNSVWAGGSLISLKCPTCVLFDEKKQFHSFGYEAEDKYSDLVLHNEHEKWYYFHRFKRILDNKQIEQDMKIQDDKGLIMPASKVFGCAIRFLKTHLLNSLKSRGAGVAEKDIHWVLTAPATWSDSAKQFMREAAVEYAEIDSGALTIVLEPVAISLYCEQSSIDTLSGRGRLTASKYIILDLGVQTADITVYKKQADGSLMELYEPTRGDWGVTKVDEAFHQILIKIIGAKTFKNFCDSHKADHIDLLRELEAKKRTINPDSGGKLTIKIPVSLTTMYEKDSGETIADALKETHFKDKMIWAAEKVRIEANLFKSLFKDCTDGVTQCVRKLLQKPEVKGVDTFLMVGVFSESPMMQAAIKEAFPNAKIIIPAEAGLVVLKGAVVFGCKPMQISSRIAKYTYGIKISPIFDASIHPQDKRVAVVGKERCKDVFKKYIQKGESMKIGERRSGKHVSLKSNQNDMILEMYASTAMDPQFITDPDCEYMGRLVVKLPKEENIFKVTVDMMFGQNELVVEAEEETSKRKFTSYFDFL